LQSDTSSLSSASITPVNNKIGSIGHDGTSRNWDGLIDELRLYNRALTQTELVSIILVR
jgi:hypothetical protein